MKQRIFVASIVLLTASSVVWAAGDAIDALNLGLSKTSVFDTPTPGAYTYPTTKAGKSKRLPRAYKGIPPQISHKVNTYLPITSDENRCLKCHDKPKLIGQKHTKKSPMSKAHYIDPQGGSQEMAKEVAGARYTCTQCHVPQANAPVLVENTFKGDE